MNEDDCIEKITITVFPLMPGIGIVEEEPILENENSCGDSSITQIQPPVTNPEEVVMKLATKDPMEKIHQLLKEVQSKYGNEVCIQIASYESKEDTKQAREWLQAALRGSGDNSILDEHAFSSFIGSSAPIISINNRLSFVGIVPNKSQFESRLRRMWKD
jgi:hypothetical protein